MFFNRMSIKIGIWYSVAFLISAILLFGLTAFLLLKSLQNKDRELLKEKVQEYSVLYARDGIKGIELRLGNKEAKHVQDFIVRLADSSGKSVFMHSPDRSDDENALKAQDIDAFLSRHSTSDGWILIPGDDFGDDVEVVSKILPNGELLQVGKDTEDREDFFQSFTQAYIQGLVPILLLAILVGGFLSHRLLKPIRSLTQTVHSIRSGNTKARVVLHSGKDELWHLGHLFNQMLEQNERLVQRMRDTVDDVAHDLRTPVMRLQNAVESALREKVNIEIYKDALIDCKENSELLLKLVDGIMDISEAEAGTLRLKSEPVFSNELIDGAIDLYGFVAEEKDIRLSAHIHQAFSFNGDRMRLLQVVSNLVDNAIKYSQSNTQVKLESNIQNGYGVISVIDQGVGIAADDLPRIWDRLYRTDTSRSSRGLGLGLSLVKAIVYAHDGTVDVQSDTSGNGTKFFLKFKIT